MENKSLKLVILGSIAASMVGCVNFDDRDERQDKHRGGGWFPYYNSMTSPVNNGAVYGSRPGVATPARSSAITRSGFGSIGSGFGSIGG